MLITLMEHQKEGLDFIKNRRYSALFFDTGTGKTPIGLEAFEYWYAQGLRKFVCIVPNTLTGTWLEEAARFHFALNIVRIPPGKNARIDLVENGNWDVLVVNFEAARTLWPHIVASNPQALVIDELQRVKNRKSLQTKGCRQIASAVKKNGGCIVGLTGTPVVDKPFDLWSEFDVLSPSGKPQEHPLGFGNYWAFESSVSDKRPHPHLGFRVPVYTFPDEKLERLKRRVAPLALEKTKDDCLDLPLRTFQKLYVELEGSQRKFYDALKNDMVAYLGGAEATGTLQDVFGVLPALSQNPDALLDIHDFGGIADEIEEQRVSVTFATTLMLRLHQVASGFIKRDNDDTLVDFEHNAKIDLMRDMLPEWTNATGKHKLIIFHRYTHDREILKKLLEEMKIGYVSLSGENSKHAADIVRSFQTDDSVRVFVGNVQVASVGITLTAADYVVFYNNSFQLEHRMQAIDRAYRIGQTRKVSYYDLIAKKTVDERVIENLETKRTLAIKSVGDLLAALQ